MARPGHALIFVVDDEPIIANTLLLILESEGYSVEAFTNPLKALESATLRPPTLVLSDVVMPELSGVEFAIRLKQLNPSCKLLLFSGQAVTIDLLAQARHDGHDFRLLEKPLHPSELLKEIAHACSVAGPFHTSVVPMPSP
jgi:CheY-like chemotaxis protein